MNKAQHLVGKVFPAFLLGLLLFPRMNGDFTSRETVLVQLPAGHVKRPQLVLMLPLEFLSVALPL